MILQDSPRAVTPDHHNLSQRCDTASGSKMSTARQNGVTTVSDLLLKLHRLKEQGEIQLLQSQKSER